MLKLHSNSHACHAAACFPPLPFSPLPLPLPLPFTQALCSWYPLVPITTGTCACPNISILAQEFIYASSISVATISPLQTLLSWRALPAYCLLTRRYACLWPYLWPSCSSLTVYMLRRGLRLIASRVYLTGLPMLLWTRDAKPGMRLASALCLAILSIQLAVRHQKFQWMPALDVCLSWSLKDFGSSCFGGLLMDTNPWFCAPAASSCRCPAGACSTARTRCAPARSGWRIW